MEPKNHKYIYTGIIIIIVVLAFGWASKASGTVSDYKIALESRQMLVKAQDNAKKAHDMAATAVCLADRRLRIAALQADMTGEKKLSAEERARIGGLLATIECVNFQ